MASIAAIVRGSAAAALTYLTRPRTRLWVDDGMCGCSDCCPWLAGDAAPAGTPLPAELVTREKELWPS